MNLWYSYYRPRALSLAVFGAFLYQAFSSGASPVTLRGGKGEEEEGEAAERRRQRAALRRHFRSRRATAWLASSPSAPLPGGWAELGSGGVFSFPLLSFSTRHGRTA